MTSVSLSALYCYNACTCQSWSLYPSAHCIATMPAPVSHDLCIPQRTVFLQCLHLSVMISVSLSALYCYNVCTCQSWSLYPSAHCIATMPAPVSHDLCIPQPTVLLQCLHLSVMISVSLSPLYCYNVCTCQSWPLYPSAHCIANMSAPVSHDLCIPQHTVLLQCLHLSVMISVSLSVLYSYNVCTCQSWSLYPSAHCIATMSAPVSHDLCIPQRTVLLQCLHLSVMTSVSLSVLYCYNVCTCQSWPLYPSAHCIATMSAPVSHDLCIPQRTVLLQCLHLSVMISVSLSALYCYNVCTCQSWPLYPSAYCIATMSAPVSHDLCIPQRTVLLQCLHLSVMISVSLSVLYCYNACTCQSWSLYPSAYCIATMPAPVSHDLCIPQHTVLLQCLHLSVMTSVSLSVLYFYNVCTCQSWSL